MASADYNRYDSLELRRRLLDPYLRPDQAEEIEKVLEQRRNGGRVPAHSVLPDYLQVHFSPRRSDLSLDYQVR